MQDGETVSLGDKTIEFVYTPWVHWPETMSAYLQEDKIVFSCDFFGSHLATSELFVTEEARVYQSAKRYFAEIMMPFKVMARKNLERLAALELDFIAPSHGPIYSRPQFILDAHRRWLDEKPENLVVLPYISMHHSTKLMVDYLVSALVERDVRVQQFDLTEGDIGQLAMYLVDGATIVVGSPAVLGGPHPKAAYAALLANALRPKARFLSVIGSYGWGSKMVETLSGLVSSLKVEVIEPVLAKGLPREETYRSLDILAESIAQKHRELGLE